MLKIFKKIIFFAVLIGLIFSVSFFLKKINSEKEVLKPKVLGLPLDEKVSQIDLSFKGKTFRFNFRRIENIDNLTLSANLEKLTSEEFKNENKCTFLSSGGYYKADYTPTGLLISEYNEVTSLVKSSLADAIFSVNDFATPRITREIPKDRLRLALQAGPLLKENGEFVTLSLRNDEEARRVILGTTGENEALFLIVYDPFSVYSGPLLKDLPDLLNLFEDHLGIVFADAMNLDGGTPTVFSDESVNLTEASIIGSFFCLK